MARNAAKKEQELTLEEALWNCRTALRGVGSIEKNRDAVISLVFLKFSSDKFEARRAQIPAEVKEKQGIDPCPDFMLEQPSFYNAANVFYLPEESRWSYLVANSLANDIALKIDAAMEAAQKENPSLAGALPLGMFATLGAEIRSVKALIDNIGKISEERFHEDDLIGRVYEYFLQSFAAGSSKEDGEFYTPACVVQLIAELIEPYEGVVYDPCCGSGGMFVQSHKFVERHNGNRSAISVVGQESNPETWRLCKMNLAIRGISNDLGAKAASTFTSDQHPNRKVDYIMANPPFNLKAWRGEKELTKDPRWRGYATPPVSNANYAWILHMLSKLDVNHGIAGFLLANGALNADGDEAVIRKKLLENDKVEAVIVLPRDMFYTTDISVTLWIMNMNKKACERNGRSLRDRTGEVLFMDLRTWDGNIEKYKLDKNKSKKKTVLTPGQIARVKAIYEGWQDVDGSYEDVPELCKSVRVKSDDSDELTIESRGWSLAPSKYIEFVDHDLCIDYEKEMARIQTEMKELLASEKQSQAMLEAAFEGIGYGIE
ncbi:N-6 DNA methylase [Paratractidigestivibacter sp.]|uniref:N-6 DNA methylase n=1 Tax=Paratractidigestivibacter sp. TaxID=2847316 RepID=UPI002AC9357C|nr:N-6 DNA methylase [Paratractidigestivibacter sp.]